MKEVLGYFIIALTILTGAIIYSIERLSNSVKQSIGFLKSESGTLSSGDGLPGILWFSLIIVIGIGLFLITKKK